MTVIKQLKKRGFTLVELMIVVVIIGILAALAIYGVQKYVNNSKSAEARMAVGRMAKDGATLFEAERMSGALMGLGSTVGSSHQLCPSAANAVPSAAPTADGVKYQPQPSDWDDDAGWSCLKFSMSQPIYFQYQFASNGNTAGTAAAAAGDGFTAFAGANMGGIFKKIYQNADIVADSAGTLVLVVAPALCDTEGAAATTTPSVTVQTDCSTL